MLPSSPQVRSVYTDANGVLSALHSLSEHDLNNTLCIDSTTLDVNVARHISSDVINAGAQMVDAPVSGGNSFSFLFFSFLIESLYFPLRAYLYIHPQNTFKPISDAFLPKSQVSLVRKPARFPSWWEEPTTASDAPFPSSSSWENVSSIAARQAQG